MTGLCTLQEFLQLLCGYLFCVSCPPWECTENSIPASSRQNLQVLKAITSSTSGKLGNFLVNVVSSRGFFYPTTPLSLTTGAKGCCHMKTSLSTAINITCVATFQALLRPHLVTLFLKKLPCFIVLVDRFLILNETWLNITMTLKIESKSYCQANKCLIVRSTTKAKLNVRSQIIWGKRFLREAMVFCTWVWRRIWRRVRKIEIMFVNQIMVSQSATQS